MKIIFALLFLATTVHAQKGCFEDCWTNAQKSKGTILQRNNQVIAGLVGCKAPDFRFEGLNGEVFSLHELEGKVVVVNFWFTECAPCRVEMPALNKLFDAYSSTQDIVFLSFARSSREEVIEFMKDHNLKYRNGLIPQDLDMSYCILGWPMNIVLDKKGIVRYVRTGGPVAGTGKEDQPYLEMKPIIDESLSK